jgi:F0F1-type ATP synthase membrane subunit b/b'
MTVVVSQIQKTEAEAENIILAAKKEAEHIIAQAKETAEEENELKYAKKREEEEARLQSSKDEVKRIYSQVFSSYADDMVKAEALQKEKESFVLSGVKFIENKVFVSR